MPRPWADIPCRQTDNAANVSARRVRCQLLARQTGVAFTFLHLRKHFLEQKLNPRQYLTFRIVRLQKIQTLRGRRETTELV